MEYMSIDTLVAIIGLFIGGGGGAFFTWRWQRRKAKAEAKREEQGYYQQMMEDIARDRDYYKQERDELRGRLDSMAATIRDLQMEVAKNGRKLECLRPFLCGRSGCKDRICVEFSESGEVTVEEPKKKK